MAGPSVIGALRVTLGLDTAAFEAGTKRAGASVSNFGAAVKTGMAVAATAAAAAVTGMAVAMRSAINEADKMGKMAQSVGVPVEELTRLKHAADLSDVSIEQLATAMGRLSRNMLDAARGASGPSKAFDQLGISVKNADGSLKSSTQIMTEVAGKFAGMKDGAVKTALAMEIFGRAGAQMIPMLNAGADGLREMMAEAEALGLVISTDTKNRAEAFNDNLTRMQAVMHGVTMQVTAEMLPALERVSAAMVIAAKNSNLYKGVSDTLGFALKVVSSALIIVAGEFSKVWAVISGGSKAAMYALSLNFSKAAETLKGVDSTTRSIAQTTSEALRNLWSKPAAEIEANAPAISEQLASPIVQASKKTEDAAEKMADAVANWRKRAVEGLASEAQRVFDATRTPLENLNAEIENLNNLLELGSIDWDTYKRAISGAQDQFDEATERADQNAKKLTGEMRFMKDAATHAFDAMVFGGEKLNSVLSNVLRNLANVLANKAFESIIGSLFGGGGGTGSIFGFADGGRPPMGRASIVGERGPELFVPDTAGTIIPNGEWGGSGGGQDQLRVTIVASPEFDAKIEQVSSRTSRQVVAEYDRHQLPSRVMAIGSDPRSR